MWQALEDEQRWDDLAASVGVLAAGAVHDWDDDPAAWVRAQRTEPERTEPERTEPERTEPRGVG